MYEENDEQNGNDANDQSSLGMRIANMLRVPQASGQDDGDYVNPNIALRVDPNTGVAYRFRPGLTGSGVSGPDGQNGQMTDGQGGQGATYMPPIQTRDAQGKTLPKYRMGVGQRILASVANFAKGFAGNGAAPVYVGPGALNNRYYQDEGYREQVNDENAGLRRNAIDWRTIAQDPTTKKWYGKTYGGQRQEIETPPWAVGQSDPAEAPPNNNDEGEVPPIGAQVGPSSARQRFARPGDREEGIHGTPGPSARKREGRYLCIR